MPQPADQWPVLGPVLESVLDPAPVRAGRPPGLGTDPLHHRHSWPGSGRLQGLLRGGMQ